MRKTRHELPPVKKLNVQFDIQKLRADMLALESSAKWDGLGAEYAGLCMNHGTLPPFFLKDNEQIGATASYQQLALSEFDDTFSLEQRTDKSGTLWDTKTPKNKVQADERFYRRPIAGIPVYLNEVLNYFRPHLHRARFAKILPHSEVKPHIDYDPQYSVRYHIPIFTHETCLIGYERNGEKFEMHLPADGSVYFLNQGLKHWATNPTDQPRIHLILSVDSQLHLNESVFNEPAHMAHL